jgi:serine/threonine-protein kinase ULK4
LQIPGTTVALVASILRKGEDDVTQHYALKTIENIASQGGEWAARFTSPEVLDNLCYTFRATAKPENLRATSGSCLVRLVRFSPATIPIVLEKLTFRELVGGLAKGSAREQQVNINLLNMALVGSSVIPNMNKYLLALLDERSLVPSVVAMLEQVQLFPPITDIFLNVGFFVKLRSELWCATRNILNGNHML